MLSSISTFVFYYKGNDFFFILIINYISLFTVVRLWTTRCLLVQVPLLRPREKDMTAIICHKLSDTKWGWTAIGVSWVSGPEN